MKRRRSQLVLVLSLAANLLLLACGGGGQSPGNPGTLAITTSSLRDAMTGQTYRQTLRATGGTPPYTWSVASGSLPSGLSLDAILGSISGIPAEAGDFNFTAQVKDHKGRTASLALSLHVVEGVTVVTVSLPDAWYNQPYSQTLVATGGSPPYLWSLAAGSLPPGMQMSGDGLISGTATQTWGTFPFTVQVTDADSISVKRDLQIALTSQLTISLYLTEGNLETSYLGTMYANGGIGPYRWSLAPGSAPLPPGLTLDGGTGQIQGIPTAQGTFNFTIQVSDSGSPTQIVTLDATIIIHNNLFIKVRELPVGVRDWPYHEGFQAAAGTPPYTWSLTGSGSLPAGLTLEPSGEVSGTPSQEGSFGFGVKVTDSGTPPQSVATTSTLTVNPPLAFAQTKLEDAVLGRDYYGYIRINGGRPPFSLALTSPTLPPGLSLSDFAVTGIPSELGIFSFSAQVTDSSSPPATVPGTLSIRVSKPLVVTTTSLPNGITGDPYSTTLTATGGLPPYTWLPYGGSLPVAGLALDPSTGQLSGTPTEPYAGTIGFYMRDSAAPAQTVSFYLSLRIAGRLAITTSHLPAAKLNVPYRVSLGVFGGTMPYTWSITSGNLPSGLNLNSSSGQISGTPSSEETQEFTVQVTDTGPPVQTASRTLSLTISNSLGRNDSIATATPLSNGTFRASISPYADPAGGLANPDNDYYALTANPGAKISVEIFAQRLIPSSPLDSVIEIVDSEGARFTSCRSNFLIYDPYAYPCMNDDFEPGVVVDSKLGFQAPGEGTTPVTFYIHVLDWSGNARPDFIYDLVITGAN
jgi:hypothetical protein